MEVARIILHRLRITISVGTTMGITRAQAAQAATQAQLAATVQAEVTTTVVQL